MENSYANDHQRQNMYDTTIELWAKQLTKCVQFVSEYERIKKFGNRFHKKQARHWLTEYYRLFFMESIVAIMKLAGIYPDQVSERFESFSESDELLILDI